MDILEQFKKKFARVLLTQDDTELISRMQSLIVKVDKENKRVEIHTAFDKVEYVDVAEGDLRTANVSIDIPSNKATPEELVLAHKYNDLHLAGKDDEIPYKAMMLTTVVAEAGRMVRLENAPDNFDMPLSALAIGPVALIGMPGEPFVQIGRELKETPGWELVLPTCITNGYMSYFPMKDAYDEGGYEARSSSFKSGVAELIIEVGKDMLNHLRK